jgi:hypothetical protein
VIGRRPIRILLFFSGALTAIAGCAPASSAEPAPRPAADDSVPPAPRLVWKTPEGGKSRHVVEVIGADQVAVGAIDRSGATPDLWRAFLSVKALRKGAARDEDIPPMLGTYRVDGQVLRFEPRFPLEPGVRYRAEFDPVRLHAAARSLSPSGFGANRKPPTTARLTADFALLERPAQPTAIVTAVYPSASTLPENLLRFYIHFSAPMSRGEAYRHIRLLDMTGQPVADPFLELEEELWSGDGRRFTLLFDPGRIKRGLRPREEVGPVLEAGRSYELVIDPGWPDAAGNPLKSGYRKKFRAGPPDETSPTPKTWDVRPARPGTRDPLEVRFPEPLDRALLDRLMAVRDDSDRPVTGCISVSDVETFWRFTPDTSWRPGMYRLVIGTELEDVAGNSIARPFEVDAVGPISRRISSETVALPFRIGPPSP